ncbi:type I restriction-modification system methyltransferase subunit [Desulfitobacterium dichloroeliminans LMG P-21439]|uniref:site-specific DNA-methyltransferase (adenine-specific) n=1 Tax=Desulfitobacterium dichloroeliminans (strain LMG P-21439 / DCA1) TaxID=871963 RepID=L0F7S2_DESDL|nr:TaqI-like C-terminal specificity domain-containing protein [Desulfitobacterium dichloroeliminans]AGA69247.1 type I restriction-modification system methyltransferase subunit [Desulfitobacterium dichloroeliminans LMG P-21439]
MDRSSFKSKAEYMNIDDVCAYLSISKATAKNWIRSNKLKPIEGYGQKSFFLRGEVAALLKQIKSGALPNLKTRRNKAFVSGAVIPKNYLQNKLGIDIVENIIAQTHAIDLPEDYARVILAEYALKLLNSRNMGMRESAKRGDLFSKNPENCILPLYLQDRQVAGCYYSLISDLLEGIKDLEIKISRLSPTLCFPLTYIDGQDVLGLLYMSLQNIGARKTQGVYYTPSTVVRDAVDQLMPELNKNSKLLDPCCGTGNFLIYAHKCMKELEGLYGYDIDPLSVSLTRINMALATKTDNIELLYRNFICQNALLRESQSEFDVIIGNPPWGFNYNLEEQKTLREVYCSAHTKTVESFCVFTEFALKNVIDGGKVAFVLPQSLLNVKIHQPLRDYLWRNAKIKRIRYWDDVFDGVQCPAITLTLEKDQEELGIKGMEVVTNYSAFNINSERVLAQANWNFNLTDEEYTLLQKIESADKIIQLKDKADFALGIVTGDNKKFLSNIRDEFSEPIYRGSDVFKYKCRPAKNFLRFEPSAYQQIAPINLYRAKEKLIYRFIGGKLIFAYDSTQTLTLNSANIMIPKIEDVSVKYILAVLNSRVVQYYFNKRFNTLKILRSQIEDLPIPILAREQQFNIVQKVDGILAGDDPDRVHDLYEAIDVEVKELFGIADSEYESIKRELIRRV